MEVLGVPNNNLNLKVELPKRRMLNLSEKIELIKLVESSPKSKKDIAAKFGIPINTVGTIYAKRERLLQQSERDYTNLNFKRIRSSSYPDIEEGLLNWYIKNYASKTDAPVSVNTLREMALQVAKSLGYENFSASNGWIERFKVRHNLQYRKNKRNLSAKESTTGNTCEFGKSDIPLNGNLSEKESCNHMESNVVWQNVSNPVMELTEVNQEYDDSYSPGYESHSVLPYVTVKQEDSHFSQFVPDVHLRETDCNSQSFSFNVSNNYSLPKKNCSVTIQDVEESFNVIRNYVRNCSGNVTDKTLEAVKELKSFISAEKDKTTQSKITDYFHFT